MSDWLSASAAAEHVGPRRQGRPTHPLTVRAWWGKGLAGVVLRSELRGGLRCTKAEWVEQFFKDVEGAKRAVLESRRAELPPPPAALARRRAKSDARRAKLGI